MTTIPLRNMAHLDILAVRGGRRIRVNLLFGIPVERKEFPLEKVNGIGR
jgi:hypothetical protein